MINLQVILSLMISIILMCCFVILFGQLGLRFIYGYSIEEHSLNIKLFRTFSIYKIPFRDIIDIRRAKFSDLTPLKNLRSLFILRLGNRIWGNEVIITRKSLSKQVVITPDDAEAFVRDVKYYLVKQTQ